MSRRLIRICFALAAIGALLFPARPSDCTPLKRIEPQPLAILYAVSRKWNPVPAAEVYFSGPHCARPALPAEEYKNPSLGQVPADDPPSWEWLFLEPWTLQDFQRLHYEELLENFPMGGEGLAEIVPTAEQ